MIQSGNHCLINHICVAPNPRDPPFKYFSMNARQLKDLIFQQLTRRCTSELVEIDCSTLTNGKGLFTRLPVSAGEIVFEEYPIGGAAVPYFDSENVCCSNCLRPLRCHSAIVKCELGCGAVFCGQSCLEWAQELYHAVLCTAKNRYYKRYHSIALTSGNEYYIIAARLINMFPNAPWLYHYECPEWTSLVHESPPEDLESENASMASLLTRVINQEVSSKTLSRTIGMLRINVLSLRHGDLNLGFALYSTQSLMNHSKEPNCRCVTISSDEHPDNPGMCTIEALTDLCPGDELTINYLDGMSDTDREFVLKYQYDIVE